MRLDAIRTFAERGTEVASERGQFVADVPQALHEAAAGLVALIGHVLRGRLPVALRVGDRRRELRLVDEQVEFDADARAATLSHWVRPGIA